MRTFIQSIYGLFTTALLFLLISLGAQPAHAQMFSVSGDAPQTGELLSPPSSISPSLQFVNFSYYGPGGEDLPEDLFNFTGELYGLAYESESLTLSIADRTSLGPEEEIRATRVGLAVRSPATLVAQRNYRITIPFGLNTDYTLVRTSETANSSSEFAQNSGYVSAGIDALFRISDNILLQSVSTPYFGYTVGSFGSTGGISYKLKQDIRLSVNNIFRQFGMVAGYSFDYARFNNSDTRFRYDWTSHSVMLGVTF